MAASSLPDLLQFEKHFEDAATTFLTADVGITTFISAEISDLVTPRLEIEFISGEAELPIDDPITSVPSLSAGEYRKYTGEFMVTVVTDPTVGETRANHFLYVGKVRTSLLRSEDNWDSSTLPYYDLKFIRQIGTSRETDGDFQITTISYEIRFAIRDDMFPTS